MIYHHWHVSIGNPITLGNQCPFEEDTAHLVRSHGLTDSEVPAFQTSGMSSVPPGDRNGVKAKKDHGQIHGMNANR